MTKAPKRSKSQIEKFRETARAHGADKTERGFANILKGIAKPSNAKKAKSPRA